jgi:hypothetical protein
MPTATPPKARTRSLASPAASGIRRSVIERLYHVTSGTQNTATGYQTLFSNTTGSLSTAYGSQSLYHNTTGSFNTATGFRTLYSNTTGSHNTGNGYEALAFTTTGVDNTANGFEALYSNTSGNFNTAIGFQALYRNTIDGANTANGYQALYSNTLGFGNTATGYTALFFNTTSNANTADGYAALAESNIGSGDTAMGFGALGGVISGNYDTALGYGAGDNLTQGDNNIYIGNNGPTNVSGFEDNTIRIGDPAVQTNTFVAGISGVTVSGGTAVYINSDGQLGTNPSSARFKEGIKPMGESSEDLFSLQPVTFQYKKKLDPSSIPQFGLVAEEVEKVNPDLIVRDKEGKPYSVRYDQVNAMLLNEFLKEHRKVEQLEKQIEALTAGLQKVSTQLEASKAATQVVNNTQ